MNMRATYNERTSNAATSDEFFPTPPWATRALIKYALPHISGKWVMEPACGAGHMSEVLKSYGCEVEATDFQELGYSDQSRVVDFLDMDPTFCEWVITNPPFNLGADFALKALEIADQGVALLVRTQFAEGLNRYNRLFKKRPPDQIWQYVERVPFNYGFVGRRSNLPGSYCWMIWGRDVEPMPVQWIPPCRKELELDGEWTPQCSFKRKGSKVCCNPVNNEGDLCEKHKEEVE